MRGRTIAEEDGGHGREDSAGEGELDVALLLGLHSRPELVGSHR
jgi:hypothetical protein